MTTTGRPIPSLDVSRVEGTFSATLLSWIDVIDEYGAATWSLKAIAFVTVIVLGTLKIFLKKKQGVDWYSLVHAVVTGYASLVCVYLSNDGELLTGTPEPLRSVLCQGPLTSLHRMIPAITLGFGLFDIIDGFTFGVDFILHGLATFTIMGYFTYYNVNEIIVPMLLMEISTVYLSFVRADFLSDLTTWINMACFVVTFVMFRIIACPYLWFRIVKDLYEHHESEESQQCLPWHFLYVVFMFGMFFHVLNSFWMYKIVKKIQRKMSGTEKLKGNNDLQASKDR